MNPLNPSMAIEAEIFLPVVWLDRKNMPKRTIAIDKRASESKSMETNHEIKGNAKRDKKISTNKLSGL